MTAFSDETGRDWLPLKYEDGPDFCTVTFATGAAFALTVHPERMKLVDGSEIVVLIYSNGPTPHHNVVERAIGAIPELRRIVGGQP